MTGATRPDLAPLPSAAAVVSYMRATGWAHGRQGSHGAMWVRGDVEFSVPHEDHNPAWLREVIARLASAEGRAPEETAAAVAEYRDARGPAASAGVPAVTSPAPAPPVPPATATGPAGRIQEDAAKARTLLSGALLDELARRVREYENAIDWNTSCTSCARGLDRSIAEYERAERAEARLAAIAGYCKTSAGINYGLVKADAILAITGTGEEDRG